MPLKPLIKSILNAGRGTEEVILVWITVVIKQHNQKHLVEDRIYFSLYFHVTVYC